MITAVNESQMSRHYPEIEAERLHHLSEEVSRIASSLRQLSTGLAPSRTSDEEPGFQTPEMSEETVAWIIRARRQRSKFLPGDLFAEPAWDILLDLFRSEIVHQRVSVSSLCIAAGVPATTALRYIKAMTKQGLIIRRPDPRDGRRFYLELSPEMSSALRSYFADVSKPAAIKGPHGRR